MSMSEPIPPIEPATDKYWITTLNTTSVKSPFAIKFTLKREPENIEEIKKWLAKTFTNGCKYKDGNGLFFAEIFFRNESDATMFVLQWGESFT